MPAEEGKRNGEVKQEVLSSSDGMLTYRRRKRARGVAESDCPPGDAGGGSADEEVLHSPSTHGKGKDFGWEHGTMVNGNRYHWKCNWCNYVGRSGGVTRLKKHLAGGWHVTPCRKVPDDVSEAMNNHLLELKNKRLLYRKREKENNTIDKTTVDYHRSDISVGEDHEKVALSTQVINHAEQSGRATKSCETQSQQSGDSDPRSNSAIQQLDIDMTKVADVPQLSSKTAKRFRSAGRRARTSYRRTTRSATQRSQIDVTEVVKEPDDIMSDSNTDTLNEGDLAGANCHWRNVLRDMLQLPDVREGGGIKDSLTVALKCFSPGNHEKPQMCNSLPDTAEPKDRHNCHIKVPGQAPMVTSSANTLEGVSESGSLDQTDTVANKQKCQSLFSDILCSEKFVSLCNLLCESFQGIKVDKFFDISQINSKMKNGVYGQSPELLNQDLQEVWRKFQKVGEEIVLFASNLSNMSQNEKQVGVGLAGEICMQKGEEICQDVVVAKNSNESETATQFPSCESVPSTKPDQTAASGLYKVCTCKQCGTEADVERSLICDECEAVYHFSCVEPSAQEIPTRSWYCVSCAKERTQSSDPPAKSTQQETGAHNNCAVCERLEFSKAKEDKHENGGTAAANDSRESSVSSMESDNPPEPSTTALSRLCKQCGTCEDDDKRFLICGHSQCPYKYYHIRCLTPSQIASPQQAGQECWYCPSCLCRACFRDRDDDMIVLCDNCDEAYHTYCMKPPRNSIPKGQWYCLKCNVAKAKEGMRRYEQWILQQHGKKDVRQGNEANRSMDVLLSAVEKLSSEENLAAERKQD